MILSRVFEIKKDKWLNEQFNLSTLLYNQGRHFINEYFNQKSKFLSYFELDKLLKNLTELNYYRQMCKSQVAQQCLIQLNSNYKSYFKALKDFKVNPSKYKGIPKKPKFKNKQNGITFTYQSIKIKGQFIVINKEHKFHIPDEVYIEELNNFKTISFIPVYNKIKVIIVYETKELNSDLNLDEYKLFKMLEYKCKRIGIKLVQQEESYTSKCDALSFEEVKRHDTYKGSRIKRGLFLSSIGKVLNADINGALNILRKYLIKNAVDEFSVIQKIIDRGLFFRPYRISFY